MFNLVRFFFVTIAFLAVQNAVATTTCIIETAQRSDQYPDFQFTHYRETSPIDQGYLDPQAIAECNDHLNEIFDSHCSQEPGGRIYMRAYFYDRGVISVYQGTRSCQNRAPATPPPTPVPPPPPPTPSKPAMGLTRTCILSNSYGLRNVPVWSSDGKIAGTTDSTGCVNAYVPLGRYYMSATVYGQTVSGYLNYDRDGKAFFYDIARGQLTSNY